MQTAKEVISSACQKMKINISTATVEDDGIGFDISTIKNKDGIGLTKHAKHEFIYCWWKNGH
jgi:signal transduction histidine kinase